MPQTALSQRAQVSSHENTYPRCTKGLLSSVLTLRVCMNAEITRILLLTHKSLSSRHVHILTNNSEALLGVGINEFKSHSGKF